MATINAKGKDLKEISQVLKTSLNGRGVTITDASHLHGLAAGLKQGEVIVDGNAGDYIGVLNDGAVIEVTENVGKYAADNMTSGTVTIKGDADYGAGQYCYGGTIVIYGEAGDFTATMNKGATIIVAGDVGNEAGTYMLDGELIVVGNAGENFANYLIRGDVYIGGEWKSLGHNTKTELLTREENTKLEDYFRAYSINADPNGFRKIVAASEKPFYK
jgi:glutamate synthase domain-containing protein 3